jgi:5-methyltetrahydropteroyltriglutamate--homocysteine methyltransferase
MAESNTPTIERRSPRQPARAETVGSLLRPPAVRELFQQIFADQDTQVTNFVDSERQTDLRRLNELADQAIRDAVRRQIDAGLDVVSDGEMRRAVFENSLYEGIEGISPNPRRAEFTDDAADTAQPPSTAKVTGKVRKVGSPAAREAAYLRSVTAHPFKVTFPAASMLLFPETGLDTTAYATRDEMVADMLGIYREMVADAVAAGASYIQFDFPIYPMLIDRRSAAALEELGESLESLLAKAIAADAAAADAVPDGVTSGLHLCRGNYRSHWFLEGGLDAIAERILSELPYDRFLFEWEDVEREGSYEPIKYVPKGRTMVMGIVSTKRRELEHEDELMRRMEEATRHLDLSQLAISPQCGFASVWEGNAIDEEAQWRKLELVGRVADRLWGRLDRPSGNV